MINDDDVTTLPYQLIKYNSSEGSSYYDSSSNCNSSDDSSSYYDSSSDDSSYYDNKNTRNEEELNFINKKVYTKYTQRGVIIIDRHLLLHFEVV